MAYKNKADQAASARRYYEKNRSKVVERARQGNKEHKAKLRATIERHKAQPCADCRVPYPPCVMDFDHVHGQKLFNIANALSGRWTSVEELEAEIAKCEVVCANCHRLRTHRRRERHG